MKSYTDKRLSLYLKISCVIGIVLLIVSCLPVDSVVYVHQMKVFGFETNVWHVVLSVLFVADVLFPLVVLIDYTTACTLILFLACIVLLYQYSSYFLSLFPRASIGSELTIGYAHVFGIPLYGDFFLVFFPFSIPLTILWIITMMRRNHDKE